MLIVEILKNPSEEDWNTVKMLAMNTVGKTFVADKPMSGALKEKYLKSEHSPIRALQFIIKMQIPYYVSTHLVRHKIGVEHFVQSQRNDRQDKYDRTKAPQDSMVSHIMLINAPALMQMARMRLCSKADVVTRTLMKEIVKKVNELNPEFKNVLVPKCEYLHECNEFQPCGRYKTLCSR